MTNDDIIRMAREAGMKLAWIATMPGSDKMKVLLDVDQVERFAALAAAAEREACAKVCEEVERKATHQPPMVGQGCQACAVAIRARGNT